MPLAGILPMWSDGLIFTADGPNHLHRIRAMTLFMQAGNFWPRWVPYFHLGYGYPIFNYYPPGVHWLGGVLGLVGIGAPLAFTLLMAAAWIGGTAGAYALARRWLPWQAAFLAAMLWAYSPTRLHEVWNQGSLAQMAAIACTPWLFLALAAARRPARRRAVLVALPFAAILLTHLPTAVLSVLFGGPAILLLAGADAHRDWRLIGRRLVCMSGGLLLGAGIAAIFLLPMVAELPYIWSSTNTGAEYLSDNTLQLGDVLTQPLPLDLTDLKLPIRPALGLVGGLLSLTGVAALIARHRVRLAAMLALGIGTAVFLTLPASLPLWRGVPFLSQLSFPWRSLYLGAGFVAVAGGASLLALPKRWRSAGLVATAAIALAAGLPWTVPSAEILHWDNLSAADEIRQEDATHAWGGTSYDEFQPVWGANVPLDVPDTERYVEEPFLIGVYGNDLNAFYPALQAAQIDAATVRVTLTEARPVRFRQYYFPGWTATLDGQPAEVYPEADAGLLTLDVPTGEHVIRLAYNGTPVQALAVIVSLLSVLAAIFLARRPPADSAPRSVPLRAPDAPDRPGGTRLAWAIGGGVALFALLNTLILTPQTGWPALHSPPDAPAYMDTPLQGAVFGETYDLLGYSPGADAVQPGGVLDVTLFWRMAGPDASNHAHTYRAVVQLVNLSGSAAWGVSRDEGTHYQAIPPDRFLSDRARIDVFDPIPPYVGRIKVQVVDAGSGAALRLPDGGDFLLLDPLVRVQSSGGAPGSDPAPAARLDYTLAGQIRLECAAGQVADDTLHVELNWHVLAAPVGDTPGRDATVFIHALDAAGQLVTQYNGPPLGGDYPTGQWQPGQHLADSYSLPADPTITQLAVGMFWPDTGDRLAVTQGGQPVPDNLIPLPLDTVACR